MLKKEAKAITGGLSAPSKMPGPAYNIPAAACITGSKLVNVKGSVCEGCYALKGRYRFSNVKEALNRRLKALGYKPIFDTPTTQNPLPWTQHWLSSAGLQVAPQETEVESYIVGGIKQDVNKDKLKGFKL